MSTSGPARLLRGFGLANYRSFDEAGFAISDLQKINVFIGKNNSGKSNVLRAINVLRQINGIGQPVKGLSPLLDGHRQTATQLIPSVDMPIDHLMHNLPDRFRQEYKSRCGETMRVRWEITTGEHVGPHPFEPFELRWIYQACEGMTKQQFRSPPQEKEAYYKAMQSTLIQHALKALGELRPIILVPVFREFTQSSAATGEDVFNGHNVIGKLKDMQIPNLGKEADREKFFQLVAFVRELLGESHLTLEIPKDEQIIINFNGNRLPLESYGTGIHHLVLLCAALAIYSNHTVLIEEPEVHLHPELQRHLLRFITTKTVNVYYITTHSNVFLDPHPLTSIHHVRLDGTATRVEQASTSPRLRDILVDMSYKASDLLQANGIIWVEGPSDRIYLKRWIELLDSSLVDGIHYSILFYGSWPILNHFSAQDNPIDDMVQLLRINRNAIVVMDRDGDSAAAILRDSKSRIIEELGAHSCWVTAGREIENYLPTPLIENYLLNQFGLAVTLEFGGNDHLVDVLKTVPGMKVADAKGKVANARQISKLLTASHLDVLDLRERLQQTIAAIRSWNHIPAPERGG